jgi:Zn-dependent metalloprotease
MRLVRPTRCSIVPPYVLENITRRGTERQRAVAARSLGLDVVHRERSRVTVLAEEAAAGEGLQRTVSSAGGSESLPGRPVRAEGDPPSGDVAVDEAYDGLGATYALYLDAYGRRSVDDADRPLPATVHYGRDYDNAFGNGERMVFGDGDGELFQRFTIAVDVIGHELTHAVTEQTTGLAYQGQSGALNESVSDVFGSLVKQRALGQDAAAADWLIGAGLFTDRVEGVALRSMKAPGTAYDDDVLGRDPQPVHLRDLVETTDDNGGVHINSGIPNHAFYLAATAIGGHAWEVTGRIWYDTLVAGGLSSTADFAAFAAVTVRSAQGRFGPAEEQAVRTAWEAVGVV